MFSFITALRMKWLAYRLRSTDLNILSRAIHGLGQLKDPRVVSLLLPFLDAPSPSVRYATAGALGNTGEKAAIDPLFTAHSVETDAFVKLQMAIALVNLGDLSSFASLVADVVTIDEEGKEDWDGAEQIAYEIAKNFDTKALSVLEDSISHPNHTVRWISVMALGDIQDATSVRLL